MACSDVLFVIYLAFLFLNCIWTLLGKACLHPLSVTAFFTHLVIVFGQNNTYSNPVGTGTGIFSPILRNNFS